MPTLIVYSRVAFVSSIGQELIDFGVQISIVFDAVAAVRRCLLIAINSLPSDLVLKLLQQVGVILEEVQIVVPFDVPQI